MLVAGQVALSLVLLVGAGLFLGTMRNLLTTPAGFDPRNILLVQSDSVVGVPKPQRNDLHRTILERLRTLPGVTSAACSALTPVSNMMWDQFAYPEGYQAEVARRHGHLHEPGLSGLFPHLANSRLCWAAISTIATRCSRPR